MTATALRITTAGIISTVELDTKDGGDITLDAISNAVARFVEPVGAMLDGREITFWFDEEGFFTQPGNFNHAATALLAALGVCHQDIYVGDCVVTGFEPESGASVALSEDQVAQLMQKAAATV